MIRKTLYYVQNYVSGISMHVSYCFGSSLEYIQVCIIHLEPRIIYFKLIKCYNIHFLGHDTT